MSYYSKDLPCCVRDCGARPTTLVKLQGYKNAAFCFKHLSEYETSPEFRERYEPTTLAKSRAFLAALRKS